MTRVVILLLILLAAFPGSPVHAQGQHTVIYVNDAYEVIALTPVTGEQRVLLALENPGERTRAYGLHVSPDGTTLALFVRTSDFSVPDESVRLYGIRITDGQLLFEQNLLPEGYVFPIDAPLRDPAYEMTRAVGEVIWSPDSRYVAFISGHPGNADVFAYDTAAQNMIQVNNAPQTAAFLHWSPDSKTLVFSEVITFGTGSGDEIAGIYAASLETGNVQPITFSDERIQQVFVLGWLDSSTFLYSPLNFLVGANGIFTLNLQDGSSTTLLPYEMEITVPVVDPATRALAFVVPDLGVEQGLVRGAYLLPPGAAAPTFLQSGQFYFAQWVRPGLFQYASAEGNFLLDVNVLQLVPLPASDFGVFVSPTVDSAALFRSDGVYISSLTADDSSLVLSGEIQIPLWSADGLYFYTFGFTSEGAGLLQFDVLNRSVRLLDSRMAVNSPIGVAG
ncbi:MAG: hypothetical protein K8I82_28515 [Anaerolineae bacterium]|nr:hypothetical protein [Anaerolineae bacterium]